MTLYCGDFADAPNCCSSCHEDANNGYDPLIQIDNDGEFSETGKLFAVVCCQRISAAQAALKRKKGRHPEG